MPDLHPSPSAPDEDTVAPGAPSEVATAEVLTQDHTEAPPGQVEGVAPAIPAPARAPGPDMAVMDVVNVTVELPNTYATVWLQETEMPFRQLTIPIGLPDANALAQALRKVQSPRPLTHELFSSVLRRHHIDLVALRLVARQAGTYFGELDLMGPAGNEVVECRPSDGFILALRSPVRAPILADRRLLDDEGDVERFAG